jgi:hypothetical protein
MATSLVQPNYEIGNEVGVSAPGYLKRLPVVKAKSLFGSPLKLI